MKTHKLTIKWKIFNCYTTEQAKKIFEKLIKEEIKIKLHDPIQNIFISAYLTEISLEKLDELEQLIENSNLPKRKKDEVYYILKKRDEEHKKTNETIIQNIIDEILKIDN